MQFNKHGPWGLMSRLFNLKLEAANGLTTSYPVIVSLSVFSRKPSTLPLECCTPAAHFAHEKNAAFTVPPQGSHVLEFSSLNISNGRLFNFVPLQSRDVPQAKQLHRTAVTQQLENIGFMYCPPSKLVKVTVPVLVSVLCLIVFLPSTQNATTARCKSGPRRPSPDHFYAACLLRQTIIPKKPSKGNLSV